MQNLTSFITESLGAGGGNTTMVAARMGHRQMLIAVRIQAEEFVRAQYSEIQAKELARTQSGERSQAVPPAFAEGGRMTSFVSTMVSTKIGRLGHKSGCATTSSGRAAQAATTLDALATATPTKTAAAAAVSPEEVEVGAEAEMAAPQADQLELEQHESVVSYVTQQVAEIMRLRSVKTWGKVLKGAVSAKALAMIGRTAS